MQQTSTAGDLFAYVFLIVLFAALFGIPIWLMIRYSKKSKARLQQETKTQVPETPEQIRQRRANHQLAAWGTISFATGLLFGSRILGNPLIGLILGLILAMATRALITRRVAKENQVTFDTTLTRMGNGQVKSGPIPADKFLDALESGKDISLTTKQSKDRK